jgi:aminopeptidase N
MLAARIRLLLMLLFGSPFVWAQPHGHSADLPCKAHPMRITAPAARPTVLNTAEDYYDIHHLFFDLHISDTTEYLWGSVTTRATVVAPSMARYYFELDDTLTIDSVIINGTALSCTTSGYLRYVQLSTPLPQGAAFSASVFYHGFPRAYGNHAPGYKNDTATHTTFTLTEPYFAHLWWPCKQSLRDKADSMDVWLTVPAGVRAGTAGLLTAITTVDARHNRYQWKTRYPIAYYLISIAAGRYDEYSYYMLFDGSTDSMLMQNYVSPDTPKSIADLKPWLDSTALVVNYFSSLWGRYPFWQEKYGHCYIPSFTNMEHQTMTSTRFSSFTVLVHELAHQWFGNLVTCGTWKDLWLNESFATYAQYLGYAHFNGPASAAAYLQRVHDNVLSEPGGSVYTDDTANWYRLFDGRLTYNKGAAVLHMLRNKVGNDSVFHGMMRTYLQRYAHANATTEELLAHAQQFTGLRLDTFFRQWIYGEGYPTLSARWNQAGDKCYLTLTQTPSAPSSVAVFSMDIPVRLFYAGGDTLISVPLRLAAQGFTYTCPHAIDSVVIDPDNWMLLKQNDKPAHDATLTLAQGAVVLFPNPAHTVLYISGTELPACILRLYSETGKMVLEKQLRSGTDITPVDVSALPGGNYLYRVAGDREYGTGKILVK